MTVSTRRRDPIAFAMIVFLHDIGRAVCSLVCFILFTQYKPLLKSAVGWAYTRDSTWRPFHSSAVWFSIKLCKITPILCRSRALPSSSPDITGGVVFQADAKTPARLSLRPTLLNVRLLRKRPIARKIHAIHSSSLSRRSLSYVQQIQRYGSHPSSPSSPISIVLCSRRSYCKNWSTQAHNPRQRNILQCSTQHLVEKKLGNLSCPVSSRNCVVQRIELQLVP